MKTTDNLSQQIASLQRRRVPTPLIKTFRWYRELNEEERYVVEERLAICVGSGPVTAEAWILAKQDLERHRNRKAEL